MKTKRNQIKTDPNYIGKLAKDHLTPKAQEVQWVRDIIRDRRFELKLHQTTAARYAGIGENTMGDFETGRRMTTVDNLLRICVALRLKITITPEEDTDNA